MGSGTVGVWSTSIVPVSDTRTRRPEEEGYLIDFEKGVKYIVHDIIVKWLSGSLILLDPVF